MKFTTLAAISLISLASAAPAPAPEPILATLVNGLGSLFGSPKLPNQSNSLITLPLLPGSGFRNPNTCLCRAKGSFCGYRAYMGDEAERPLSPDGKDGYCDPLGVYTCNAVDEFGSSGTCLLCVPSLVRGAEQQGVDTCAIRLADESRNSGQ